jgi:hypothetical protein
LFKKFKVANKKYLKLGGKIAWADFNTVITKKIMITYRAKLFNEISKAGYISLEQWIHWATEHIAAKSNSITKVWDIHIF